MKQYEHNVRYYETDKMGITHHSNYIRWMEDARIDFLAQIGCGYPETEAMGLAAPVLSYQCEIKESTRFAEIVRVQARITKYNGVRLHFGYEITRPDGSLVATGETGHCFINEEGRVISLKRTHPDLHEKLVSQMERE